VLGAASQLSPSKGHTHLFQALEALRREGVLFRLRVAGTGPLEEELRGEVGRRGLGDVVEFAGFQTDVPAFLSTLDAFVLPSLKEGFPNSLLEAMAAGLPVAAFDLPGVREMADGAGLLAAAGDAGDLARALRTLLTDQTLRVDLGRAARRRAEERYDLAKNVALVERLLGEVAGR
jgi:glycosyltransferase involved in cell wall biosynthesis